MISCFLCIYVSELNCSVDTSEMTTATPNLLRFLTFYVNTRIVTISKFYDVARPNIVYNLGFINPFSTGKNEFLKFLRFQ